MSRIAYCGFRSAWLVGLMWAFFQFFQTSCVSLGWMQMLTFGIHYWPGKRCVYRALCRPIHVNVIKEVWLDIFISLLLACNSLHINVLCDWTLSTGTTPIYLFDLCCVFAMMFSENMSNIPSLWLAASRLLWAASQRYYLWILLPEEDALWFHLDCASRQNVCTFV